MVDVLLFAEDDAQERFVRVLIRRLAREISIDVTVRLRSGIGGLGRVLRELARFDAACRQRRERLPDVLVVAIDANCHGRNQRKQLVEHRAGQLIDRLVCAIADPHIERWLLLDGEAFKTVLGRGCQAPDMKCEKDRYKQLLAGEVRRTGIEPLLGGIEYAEDLAEQINLQRVGANDEGLRHFVEDFRSGLRRVHEG